MLADLFAQFDGLDRTIITGVTAGIEVTANQALRYDPATRQKVAQIHHILAVTLASPNLTFYICGQEDGIRISNHCEDTISTHLSGSASALLTLLKQPTSLANTGVNVVGSISLLQQWQTILHTLDIDWEEAISQQLGDIAGPLAANGLKKAAHWFSQQTREHQRLAAEYLPEEINVTPSKTELNTFYQDINHLKLSTDRISARIQGLMNKASYKTNYKGTS